MVVYVDSMKLIGTPEEINKIFEYIRVNLKRRPFLERRAFIINYRFINFV